MLKSEIDHGMVGQQKRCVTKYRGSKGKSLSDLKRSSGVRSVFEINLGADSKAMGQECESI